MKDGRIAWLGEVPDLPATAAPAVEVDLHGAWLTPGLIDLHTHVYWGGTSIGIDPTDYARRCGTTTRR